jgi:hypothetical protein
MRIFINFKYFFSFNPRFWLLLLLTTPWRISTEKNNKQQQYETWFSLIIHNISFFTEYFMQITFESDITMSFEWFSFDNDSNLFSYFFGTRDWNRSWTIMFRCFCATQNHFVTLIFVTCFEWYYRETGEISGKIIKVGLRILMENILKIKFNTKIMLNFSRFS